MNNSIWHKPPQTPDVFKSHPIIVIYEAGDEIEQMDSTEYSDLVGERYANRWCYVDDLIKENERTRKALDVAMKGLYDIFTTRPNGCTLNSMKAKETMDKVKKLVGANNTSVSSPA